MNPIVQLIAAWAGSLGFALLFNVRGRKLAYASLGGLLAGQSICWSRASHPTTTSAASAQAWR